METIDQATVASWTFDPLPLLLLVVAGILYARGWLVLRDAAPLRFSVARLCAYYAGLLALAVAMFSPLDAFAGFFLSVHMVQHLLLTMVAPPLLLCGNPFLPILRGLPRAVRREVVAPFLSSPQLRRAGRTLTHPLFTWSAFVFALLFWHVPVFYELALRSRVWHQVEHLSFLWTSILFWWPVMQPWPSRPHWPRWAIIPYLLLADLINTALAGFLSFYNRVVYPTYESIPRLGSMTALEDQVAAGSIMWVLGSLGYLIPAGVVLIGYLSSRGVRPSQKKIPPRRQVRPRVREPKEFDLLATRIGPVLRSIGFRRTMQTVMFSLAALVVIDGFLGPEASPMNLAGVLPWTHWRAFSVVALLVAGNFFCMTCPFTFVRDLGRRFLPANRSWPKWLRTKWLSCALVVAYLWAYEAFALWDRPAWTAGIIVAYFVGALMVDGLFRGASFCKYVCPIGQFHFVQSLASPLEVRVREPDTCASCRTRDCIAGNATQRGCELELFVPRKSGNMDCTFCLDCVRACPHDNIGLLATAPAKDLTKVGPRSSVGDYRERTDLAALVLIFVFGAFANAAGMVRPVIEWETTLRAATGIDSHVFWTTAFLALTVVVLPLVLVAACAGWSRRFIDPPGGLLPTANAFAMILAPLGFGMWLAHFVFHFFTGALTPVPVIQRLAGEWGIKGWGSPAWEIGSWAFPNLPALELLLLDVGLLVSLWAAWRLAHKLAPTRSAACFLPWAALALILFGCGVWIVFQPMEMRGTLSP